MLTTSKVFNTVLKNEIVDQRGKTEDIWKRENKITQAKVFIKTM
jgi:hypothetical protein